MAQDTLNTYILLKSLPLKIYLPSILAPSDMCFMLHNLILFLPPLEDECWLIYLCTFNTQDSTCHTGGIQ